MPPKTPPVSAATTIALWCNRTPAVMLLGRTLSNLMRLNVYCLMQSLETFLDRHTAPSNL
uniref:Uncharacterized protein n=1 Tax=Arundo donax TaxID=35708 RepID=A0A0A9FTD1_ARUDO